MLIQAQIIVFRPAQTYVNKTQVIDLATVRALDNPSSREAMDLLPRLIRQQNPHLTPLALDAIAEDPHPGWIDALLPLEDVVADHHEHWAHTLMLCTQGYHYPEVEHAVARAKTTRVALQLEPPDQLAM